MSIFQTHDSPCGIFAPTACANGQQFLSFVRPANVLQRRVPYQTSAGEVVLSFVHTAVLSVEFQPKPTGYSRVLHGNVVEVGGVGFLIGNQDVRVGDRTYISGYQLEVVNVLHYFLESTEIEMRYLGR